MATPRFRISINYGATEVAYVSWTAPSGTTNTISGSPLCSVYDSAGVVVAGYSALAATGFDNTAVTAPRVWKTINTLSPVLAVGTYRIVFTFTVTNSGDSISRVEVEEGVIYVLAVP